MKKNKNTNIIKIIAFSLVMVVAVSGALAIVLSIDNNNPAIADKTSHSACSVWGHTWVEVAGISSTCQSEGYTSYKYCSTCNLYEKQKIVIPKYNAHCPVYVDGEVVCELCNKNYGYNYYNVEDLSSATDTFVDSEFVTLCGTVVTKGCNSSGTIYSLFIAGSTNTNMVRVDFGNYNELEPFIVGNKYRFTGNLVENYNDDSYKLINIDAYSLVGNNNVFLKSLLNGATTQGYEDISEDTYFYGRVIRFDAPYLALSSTTGNTANYVRFRDNAIDVCSTKVSRHFAFSIRYLREFTDYTSGNLVKVNGVVVKPRDKTPTEPIDMSLYAVMTYVGSTTYEFLIVDTSFVEDDYE